MKTAKKRNLMEVLQQRAATAHRTTVGLPCASSLCLYGVMWPVSRQPQLHTDLIKSGWPPPPPPPKSPQLTHLLTFWFLPHPLNIPHQETSTVHITSHTDPEPADPTETAFAAAEQLPAYQNYLQAESHGCHVQPFPHLPDSSLFCTHAATRLSRMHSARRNLPSSPPRSIFMKHVMGYCLRMPKSQNPPRAILKIALFNINTQRVSMTLSGQNHWLSMTEWILSWILETFISFNVSNKMCDITRITKHTRCRKAHV